MTSVVELCNAALARLGASAILSLQESSKPARLVSQLYPRARDAVLRAHPWNCALARSALARLTTVPAFGFAFAYQLPTDCLRVLALDDETVPYRIEGRMLLSDAASLRIVYVRCVKDPALFDALLGEAIAARLAAELAYPLANSTTLAQSMLQLYEQKLREARAVDAQEGTPPELIGDVWIAARA